jgi:dynein heavy chain
VYGPATCHPPVTEKSGGVGVKESDVSAIRMNLSTVSSLADVDPQTYRIALSHLFRRIGEVCGDKEQVLIDFSVGSLVAENGKVEFLFHDNYSPATQAQEQKSKQSKAVSSNEMRNRRKKNVVTGDSNTGFDRRALRKKYTVLNAPTASMIPRPPTALEQESSSNASGEEILPNSSSVFRRKLRGRSPLKAVRLAVDAKSSGLKPVEVQAYVEQAQRERELASSPSKRSAKNQAQQSKPRGLRGSSSGSGGNNNGPSVLNADPNLAPVRPRSGDRLRMMKSRVRETHSVPPVLDSFARTQAATYSGERFHHSISAKIGGFYTPEAGVWNIDMRRGGLIANGFAAFRVDRKELTEGERLEGLALKRLCWASKKNYLDQRAEDQSTLLYEYYVENQISDKSVAPIKEMWIKNALWLLSTDISRVDERRVEELVREMLEEMKYDYKISMKRSILDYVLRNTEEQQRLNITMPPPRAVQDWGKGTVPDPPAIHSREPIQRAFQQLSRTLYVNNPAKLALLEIWEKYRDHLLVDLPTAAQLPMTIDKFEEIQETQLKKVRRIFTNEWGEEVETLFKAYARDNHLTDQNSVQFFESVATLMSNQLRTIVTNSVDAYHAFFTRYRNTPVIQFQDTDHKSLCSIQDPMWIPGRVQQGLEIKQSGAQVQDVLPRNNPRPAFLQRLTLGKSQKDTSQRIIYHIPLPEVDKAVGRIFDNILRGLQGIGKVDTRIFPMMESEARPLNLNVEDEAGEYVLKRKRELLTVFDSSIREAGLLLSLYDEYAYLLDEDVRVLQDYLSVPHSLDEYRETISKYRSIAKKLERETHNVIRCPMVQLDCSVVNQRLVEAANSLADHVCGWIANRSIERNIVVCDRFKAVSQTLMHKPLDTKELVDQVYFVQQFKNENLGQLLAECKDVRQHVLFLLELEHLVGPDVLKHIGITWARLLNMGDVVKESEDRLQGERVKMEKQLEDRTLAETKILESHAHGVSKFKHYADVKKINEYLAHIHSLKQKLDQAREEITEIHDQQSKLDLPETDFYILERTVEELRPYEELWTLYSNMTKNYQHWMRGPVFRLSAEQVETDVNAMYASAGKLQTQLNEVAPDVAAVAGVVKKEIAAFKPHIPLLHILCNQGMRDRHWSQISDVVNFDLKPDKHTSLTRVLDMGIDKYLDKLMEIGEAASRQHAIEKAMAGMREEWKDADLGVKKHRDTGTYILMGEAVEDIQTLLDEHIIKTQTMKGSPFARPFAADVKEFESWLLLTQEIIEVWLKVQSMWMYLEPVFGSEDIMKQMAKEGHMFKVVDSHWHKLMAEVVTDTKVEAVTNIAHILDILKDARELLDSIQTGLNKYLETKRLYFPRFFFLSDSDLLEILSETKDPLRVQPHLKKCFEAVDKLDFRDNLDILAMRSKEGERVPMVRVINPADAKGAVERWLKEFEQVMRETIFDQADKSTRAYSQTPRESWVTQWPGQVVLAVNQIHWTHSVATAIMKGRGALAEYVVRCGQDLQTIVAKVRGNLSKLDRQTLGSLIVLDVHNRDIVDLLVSQKIDDVNSFDWMAQMRYYFEENQVKVRMITTDIEYGNEYLGNSNRLVITPLTDRCYRTLMGAIQLKLGGAPEGPAGTGKTETVKDLAKAVAIQCVVFNCSDGLDYLAMGKFFKGLAAAGAWACFDEFNRIELEVLSVVAQQITTIHQAKEKMTEVFLFEGTELTFMPRCSVFITMNPGYAGRAELPDNLKAQFRTVAMMVPDYALIAEISLYSFGFVDANPLSKKIVAVFKLCSEQLSSQDHYDYGMRAVKTVLNAAYNLRQQYQEEQENVLVLRAITDVNLPKFLSRDLPLFKGITSDLFPEVVLEKPAYEPLMDAMNNAMTAMNLQPEAAFVEKVIQLYETANVRHGLMIVGLPFAGKSTSYKVLQAALNEVAANETMEGERPIDTHVLNPKAVTIGQLYGTFDLVSRDWMDGILATTFRKCVADSSSGRRQWMLFDGPVDAIWIENMNTVLDDNKKLCLASGQIVPMTDLMNMVFEVRDLAVASPATVSRCGMVYMEPGVLGWKPIMTSWLHQLSADFKLGGGDTELIEKLFHWLVPPCIRTISGCQNYCDSVDTALVVGVMNIFGTIAKDLADPTYAEQNGKDAVTRVIESSFLFALVWSVGAAVNADGRKVFDSFLRGVLQEVNHHKLSCPFPKQGLVYDYTFDKVRLQWVPFVSLIDPSWSIDSKTAQYADILVPTGDTVRYSSLLDVFLENKKPLLFVGPTGTGKSTYVEHLMRHTISKEDFNTLTIAFSARTSANQAQQLLDDNLDRRKRGLFGPSHGKKMVLFVDDLNLPTLEEYGASPPVELMRQFLDDGGWYDYKECAYKKVVDVQMFAAMGETGGGRNAVTDRFLRHFAVVSVAPFTDKALTLIFSTLLRWHMDSKQFGGDMLGLVDKVVGATKDIYNLASEKLLPTPSKSHYTFNLRDFSGVVEGLCMSRAREFEEPATFIRLWAHETLRVFADRLVDDEDGLLVLGWLRETVKARFATNFDKVFAHLDLDGDGKVDTVPEIRSLFFGDYIKRVYPRPYCEIQDTANLLSCWTQYLAEYNDQSTKPMKLVMFRFAVEHASRISRILKQPGGNGLLVGVGGSGKQSLTRLAAFVMNMDVHQIQLTKQYSGDEWRDDLRKLLKTAGGANKPCVFLFSDSQMKYEFFLEDINSLLNSGSIPNLWTAEEYGEVIEMTRASAKNNPRVADGTPKQIFEYFTSRVKANLHIMLCMSPIGNAFRERIRMFPSLVNCCTIDWFQAWPQDALEAVATEFLDEVDLAPEVRKACVENCQEFHTFVTDLSADFLKTKGRHYYVTPTSYLELITTFQNLLAFKREETVKKKARYQTGLDKLYATEKEVKTMQVELEDMQPILVKTSEETDEMLKVVLKEKEEATKIRVGVAKEEKIASEAAAAAKAIERECEEDLAEAIPMLEMAISALDTLTNAEISELKAMKSPARGIKVVMECICIMKGIGPTRKTDPLTGKVVKDYWEASKKFVLSDPKLLKSLKAYDKDNIPAKVITKIKEYTEGSEPILDPVKIKNVSKPAWSMSKWILAMVSYDRVVHQIAPKKIKLAEAKAEYAVVKKGLDLAQAELKEVEDKVAVLQENLDSMIRKKEDLQSKIEMCNVKLDRASKLLGGLGGEKSRWNAAVTTLDADFVNITGNILISSGVIAYLGAFYSSYREQAIQAWTASCMARKVPCSEKFMLKNVLGDAVQTRSWVIDGLPNDNFSIDNAIIINNSRRWPLMIDPQGQANKWVKKMEEKNKLSVIKPADNYSRVLETALSFGQPVLLENVNEELDPALEPILLKQVFKKSNVSVIKFGDGEIEYSDRFRFYVTTKLRNPHYLPEVSTKVCLLNFMITPEGLEDQLLGIVASKEKPDLEEQRSRLVVTSATNSRKLKEIEDKILQVLEESKANVLDDENAIEVLSASKALSNEISEKQKITQETEREIDVTRQGYVPVAKHASVLFFCISDLGHLDPMYQYSLNWFIQLFVTAIAKSEFSHELEKRIGFLNAYFQYSLYEAVCRSLFSRHKLLFSLLLCGRLLTARGKMNPQEWRFLMTGGVDVDDNLPANPAEAWLSARAWGEVCRLDKLEAFEGLAASFKNHTAAWKQVYDSNRPMEVAFPEQMAVLNVFRKLTVIRCVRPDKVQNGVKDFVSEHLGREFVQPPQLDLVEAIKNANNVTPILFVLSPGSDPLAMLEKYAVDVGFGDKMAFLSLGQNQGPIAKKMIEKAVGDGTWVVLQNCHLCPSWMPELERIVDLFDANAIHPDFRLWLTSYPSKDFPVLILQNGIKLTTEPPKGLKANLMASFLRDPVSENEFYTSCKRGKELRRMAYALCFFHAIVQERRAFGPLGWNIPYGFNETDLNISVRQLGMFLNTDDEVPYKALRYLTGECNYGGRVTDDRDRRCLLAMLDRYYCQEVNESKDFTFDPNGLYVLPTDDGNVDAVRAYIDTLPDLADPEVFGMHSNADITKDRKDAVDLLQSLMVAEDSSGSGAGDSSHVLVEVAQEVLKKIPEAFDIQQVQAKYPVKYSESMHTVLQQECMRYNKLRFKIVSTLKELLKALQGLSVMSGDLEVLATEMLKGKLPSLWAAASYPSLKPLGSYVSDFVQRLKFLSDWIELGQPDVVWLPGIYFTHSFLTGALQNFARKYKIAIDMVDFEFEFFDNSDEHALAPVADGVMIKGLFFEGARWDHQAQRLADSEPKVLFSAAPVIWLKPVGTADRIPSDDNSFAYECPMYRTTERRGTLSTTGHSTNFVMNISFPSAQKPERWVMKAVAIITQLDD